ncbi:MAG: cytochrome C oxidase subunit II [Bacteroidota bacterium]
MVDSALVLKGQTIAYTCYTIAIMLVMAWFALRVTKQGKSKVNPTFFYAFVGFLVVLGVSLHIVTYNTIPWSEMDLKRHEITPDKSFAIDMANHEFILPAEKLVVEVGEIVEFDVTSLDLTYGFGLFRQDNSMLFQMQVVPGHRNDILWKFLKPGLYTIRSTEYSGPKGIAMIVENAVEVVPSTSASE